VSIPVSDSNELMTPIAAMNDAAALVHATCILLTIPYE